MESPLWAASKESMMRTEIDKMLSGERYDASAPEIQAELAATHRWLARYNAALGMAPSDRHKLLVERSPRSGMAPWSGRHFIATTASTFGSAPGCS
jgi:hypothetical protein